MMIQSSVNVIRMPTSNILKLVIPILFTTRPIAAIRHITHVRQWNGIPALRDTRSSSLLLFFGHPTAQILIFYLRFNVFPVTRVKSIHLKRLIFTNHKPGFAEL